MPNDLEFRKKLYVLKRRLMSSRKYSKKRGRMLMMVENRCPPNLYVFRLKSKPINACGTTKASELLKQCEATQN